jgi:phage repressor protein C with HTH and peptisase S24 domain
MARTALTVQKVGYTGTTLSFEAANADGEKVAVKGGTYLYVKNGGGSGITVTINGATSQYGTEYADRTITVSNGSEELFLVGRPQVVGQDADGMAYVDFSDVTSVTVAAFEAHI